MKVRIKVVQARVEFMAVAIDEDDNVYPMGIDPLVITGSEFPDKLREWPTALRALERQENERLAAQEPAEPRAVRRAKKRQPAKRGGAARNGSAPR